MSKTNSNCVIRSYKFRLFPNVNQTRELEATLETHRRLYNAALDGKLLCWETAGVGWSYYEQCRWLAIQRKDNPYYARINSTSAKQTLRKLDHAYRSFFCSKRGQPRFKSKDRFRSFEYAASEETDGARLAGEKLRLQHIGTIRVRWHRKLPDGKTKIIRLLRQANKWFVIFAVEVPLPPATAPAAKVGIDVGLRSFVTTSQGETLGDTRHLERALPELRRRQRALSRCKRGSNRRLKVKHRVTVLHAKVRECRRDMQHKVARSLVDRYGFIAAESLNIEGMRKNRKLAHRISDAGWYSFLQILIGKAEIAGGQVLLVDPRNTSQTCSSCGAIVEKSLAVRVHECACGCVLDRDVNAAKNILARGLAGILPEDGNAGIARRRSRSQSRKGNGVITEA